VYRDIDRWSRAARRLKIPTLLIAGGEGVIGPNQLQQYREHSARRIRAPANRAPCGTRRPAACSGSLGFFSQDTLGNLIVFALLRLQALDQLTIVLVVCCRSMDGGGE